MQSVLQLLYHPIHQRTGQKQKTPGSGRRDHTAGGLGYEEAVLTGIHLSSYGMDFPAEERIGLLDLIIKVHEIPEIKRIRLGSLEPRIITEEFATALAGMEKICPHFHLSLQSGCDATLKRMNRRYNTKEYLTGCELLRSAFKNPAITTDIIVGFPEKPMLNLKPPENI